MNPREMIKYKEVISHVLQLYKELTFLWDKKHNDYNIKERRQEGYKILLNAYKEYDEHANVKMLMDKIQNFRTSYIRELKKVKRAENSGQPEYVPSLWYYNALSFLEVDISSRDNFKINCSSSRDIVKSEASTSSSEGDQQTITRPRELPRKRKRISQIDPLQQYEIMQDSFEEYPQMKDDEWELLGKSIGLQLRDLNKRQLTVTQKIISDAIYYAKIGLLSEKSYIALEKSTPPHGLRKTFTESMRLRKKWLPYRKQSPKLELSSPEYSTHSETSSPLPPTQHLII